MNDTEEKTGENPPSSAEARTKRITGCLALCLLVLGTGVGMLMLARRGVGHAVFLALAGGFLALVSAIGIVAGIRPLLDARRESATAEAPELPLCGSTSTLTWAH